MLTARIIALDKRLNNYLAAFRKPWLLKTMRIVTSLGSGTLWVTVYAFICLFYRDPFVPLIYTIITAELIGLALIIVLRYLTRRERPLPNQKYLPWTPWNRYSFPSLHTSRMFMLCFVVGANYRGSFLLMLSVAIVIGFTRIYLERHFLSDVVAGSVVGGLAALVSLKFTL